MCRCDVCGNEVDEGQANLKEVSGEFYDVCSTCDSYYDDEELADMLKSICNQ